jgi:hypothetical protein
VSEEQVSAVHDRNYHDSEKKSSKIRKSQSQGQLVKKEQKSTSSPVKRTMADTVKAPIMESPIGKKEKRHSSK